MANDTTTPNMNITVPVPMVQIGPQWAIDLVGAFTTIDGHNHAPGSGALVPTVGLNINADLSFGGFNGYGCRTVRFTSQATNPSLGSDVGCLYVDSATGNLWYNDEGGHQIQLTSGGTLAGANVLKAPINATTRVLSANYTVDSLGSDYVFFCNTASGAFTLTLPTPSAGRSLVILDQGGSFATHSLTVARHAGENINGAAASKILSASWRYDVWCDGANWIIGGP